MGVLKMSINLEWKDTIKNSIGKLLLESNYKINEKNDGVIYYMKRYSEDLALYVGCPYVAPLGRPCEIILYFTVINSVEVDLLKIGTGLNFDIGYNAGTENNIKYGEKILAVENRIECFEKMILDEMHSSSYKTEWFDYYMKHDYLYYNCLKNCEEIKEEWEKLHKDVIQDIQNNAANNVEKICGNFLDGFDAAFYEKLSIKNTDRFFIKDFARQVYAQCVLDA